MRKLSPLRSAAHVPVVATLCAALALAPPAVAQTAPASTPEQLAYAKQLYAEGLAALEAEDFVTATSKFEQAYVYAPDKHVFNFNIGNAAYAAKDCAKARDAFQRFLDLVPDHPERASAQEKLLEIERSGCAKPAVPTPPVAEEPTEDSPELISRREEREAAAAAEVAEEEKKSEGKYKFNRLMITGLALGGVGVVGLITGGVGWGVSAVKKNDLELETGAGPTGFPDGNYADAEIYNADVARKRWAYAAIIGGAAGAVLTGTGIALYVIGLKRCRAGTDTGARAPAGGRLVLTGLGPTRLSGGAGLTASARFGRGRGPAFDTGSCN